MPLSTSAHAYDRSSTGPFRHIPVFDMPYPPESPNKSLPEAANNLREWLRGHQIATSPEAWAQVRRTRPDLMAARYYPNVDTASLIRHTCWIAWAFIVDDELDDGPAGRDPQRCRDAINELIDTANGEKPRGPYSVALDELWKATTQDRSREWRQIHFADFCDWLWTYHTEAVRRASGERIGLVDYIPFRCKSIAMLFYGADHAEAALGIELPPYIRRLPALDNIRHLASEHIGLLNDIFSITKDRVLGNSNAVHIVMAEQSCDLATAIRHVNALLTDKINAIVDEEAALAVQLAAAGTEEETTSQLATCLKAYKSVVRGNHDWHFEVGRYTAPEAIRDGVALYTEDLFADRTH
ncbi:terpene synthase family protein [Actinocrispum sp. NPDC049592]|uniref:terpene synthase family protein n=1 Tax=Actinocrispum sp. NPDC049592 TaxID=3154835 RepID=UPI00344A3E15